MLLSSALLAVNSFLIFDFSWLVGFLFNFLNFVWSSRIFCCFEWSSVLLSTTKMFVLSAFFTVMLGWLRNSLAAVFSWCVSNVGYFLLKLFLIASALRRSRNSGLIEITLLSRSFKIFWYKISISVFLLMLVYSKNKWQLGLKLRKSFCCWVKLQSERLIYLSILFGISKCLCRGCWAFFEE